jgi:hypothetical protein
MNPVRFVKRELIPRILWFGCEWFFGHGPWGTIETTIDPHAAAQLAMQVITMSTTCKRCGRQLRVRSIVPDKLMKVEGVDKLALGRLSTRLGMHIEQAQIPWWRK